MQVKIYNPCPTGSAWLYIACSLVYLHHIIYMSEHFLLKIYRAPWHVCTACCLSPANTARAGFHILSIVDNTKLNFSMPLSIQILFELFWVHTRNEIAELHSNSVFNLLRNNYTTSITPSWFLHFHQQGTVPVSPYHHQILLLFFFFKKLYSSQ